MSVTLQKKYPQTTTFSSTADSEEKVGGLLGGRGLGRWLTEGLGEDDDFGG